MLPPSWHNHHHHDMTIIIIIMTIMTDHHHHHHHDMTIIIILTITITIIAIMTWPSPSSWPSQLPLLSPSSPLWSLSSQPLWPCCYLHNHHHHYHQSHHRHHATTTTMTTTTLISMYHHHHHHHYNHHMIYTTANLTIIQPRGSQQTAGHGVHKMVPNTHQKNRLFYQKTGSGRMIGTLIKLSLGTTRYVGVQWLAWGSGHIFSSVNAGG